MQISTNVRLVTNENKMPKNTTNKGIVDVQKCTLKDVEVQYVMCPATTLEETSLLEIHT